MSVLPAPSLGNHPERPGPCRRCGSCAWWNGFHVVVNGSTAAPGCVRRRATCSSRDCAPSWTLYEHNAPASPVRGKRHDRPDPCHRCGSPAWWNGSRAVAAVVKTAAGTEHQAGRIRRRAKCSSSNCPAPSWTVYEGNAYPHRTIQLDVVASAVAAVEVGGKTLTESAAEHHCSRDSLRRYVEWVARLADTKDLAQACARLDPDGIAGAPPSVSSSGAGPVLQLLDRLADLFVVRGHRLPVVGSGLARVLCDQLRRFGDVFLLTRSPPLRLCSRAFGV